MFNFCLFKASKIWALDIVQRNWASSLDSQLKMVTATPFLQGFCGTLCPSVYKAPAQCLAHNECVITKAYFKESILKGPAEPLT